MTKPISRRALCVLILALAPGAAARDPLPSWNDGPAKTAIKQFVKEVTKKGAPGYVPPEQRIAAFDNDGTLWCEQPVYTQFAFAFDRVKSLAPQHPEWSRMQPFQAILAGDRERIAQMTPMEVVNMITATHSGLTSDDFAKIVNDWLGSARHPRFQRPYTELAYQPMLELLRFLRAKGFKTFIVSGGSVEFLRPWAERIYGIPPEQVVGSALKSEFLIVGGIPQVIRQPNFDFLNDGTGKPMGIDRFIGRRPVIAFGNSDGDLQMLQWTTAGAGRRLAAIVHHTDAGREFAYDRQSSVGKLDKALDEARRSGWILIDMKSDFRRVFAYEK